MARPIKEGMDYFPMDVMTDINIEIIEAKYGIEAFGIIVKLLQLIYGGKGYYCQWSEDVALIFARKNGVLVDKIYEIINTALEKGVFDSDMYNKYGILTSADIQSRYFMAKRKSNIVIIEEYALINVAKKGVSDTKTADNDVNNTTKESKENKSKVNENKVEESKKPLTHPNIDDVKAYCNEIGIMIDCERFVNHFMEKKKAVPLNYNLSPQSPKPPKGVFNNYDQKIYSSEEIEEILNRKKQERD